MNPDWIAVDWGTSKLRAWAMDSEGVVLAEEHSDLGLINVPQGGFEMALLSLVDEWLPDEEQTLVIASGMVGARQGWVEAPYGDLPSTGIDIAGMVRAEADDPRLDLRILPGLRQSDPQDVMRGEETQIFGFLSTHPEFEGMICLPGSHSKWVRISGGAIQSFVTFMTGEIFALLSEQSILRHSMTEAWLDAAFLKGIADGHAESGRMLGMLFSIRAASLLSDVPEGTSDARLSGVLIGTELAAAEIPKDQPIAIIGSGILTGRYASALQSLGYDAVTFSADQASRAGLQAAYRAVAGGEG